MSNSVRASAVAVLATCFVMNMLARGASETFAVWLLACAIFLIAPVFALLPWRRWAAGRGDGAEMPHTAPRQAPWTVRAAARDSAFWGLFAVFFFTAAAIYCASVFAFGLSAGSRGPVISTLAAALFSGGGLGAVYGAISMGMGLGAALGSWAAGLLYDLSASYLSVFAFSITAALLALAQFWIVPALRTGTRPAK